jgi:hypothetical protein
MWYNMWVPLLLSQAPQRSFGGSTRSVFLLW